jgi:peptidoglycan lytic transglycosylase
MQAAIEAQAKAAKAAKDKAAREAAAARLKALAEAKARLDAQAQQLSLATSPTLTAAGKEALARQKPLLDTLVAAGSGYPAGYHPNGASLTGTASWYGPGFVGRPTSSGVPYDPELLTCAMLAVPLGTVVHVTNLANGAAVNVLVSDHGPYVGNRVIDLSHAAAVAIGNSGLATVRIDVLVPGNQ